MKEQHKPLSAPLLRTVKSLFYSFFSPPKSFMLLLSGIILSEALVFSLSVDFLSSHIL